MTFNYFYVSKIRSVHTLERWTGGRNIRLRLFLLPIFPSSPILIMRVVWFDNLETVLTNKDPDLIFLDTNSKKSVLLKGTLMTWLHLSNLNPNSASEFSILRKEVWENSGVSLSPIKPSLSNHSWDHEHVSTSLVQTYINTRWVDLPSLHVRWSHPHIPEWCISFPLDHSGVWVSLWIFGVGG